MPGYIENWVLDDLIYEKKYLYTGGIARMSINRPDRLNAFTGTTVRHLWECMYDSNADPSIGVVILTGVGDKAFSSGGDVESEAEGEFEDSIFDGGSIGEMELCISCSRTAPRGSISKP